MSKVYFVHNSKRQVVKLGFRPAATIAITRRGDQFVYGIAICSKSDNFSRKTGRELAEARLNQNFRTLPVPKKLKDFNEKDACLHQLFNLEASVTRNTKKWKHRVTNFNQRQNTNGKEIVETRILESTTARF